jgi:hypothetical protein
MQPAQAAQVRTGCQIRRKLAEEFATAARLYAEAVSALAANSTDSRYSELLDRMKQALQDCEVTGIAFESHVRTHQCQV